MAFRSRYERGHLPNKHTPNRQRFQRVAEYPAQDAGIYRGPVNADEAVASHFKAEDYLAPYPHGYNPFAGEEETFQKVVQFRPNKQQIANMLQPIKRGYVNEPANIDGNLGKVTHAKNFKPKNARITNFRNEPLAQEYDHKVEHDTMNTTNYHSKQELVAEQANPDYEYNAREEYYVPEMKLVGHYPEVDSRVDYTEVGLFNPNLQSSVEVQHRKHQEAYAEQAGINITDYVEAERDQFIHQNQHRRHQAESVHQDADEYYDDVGVDNREVYQEPNHRRYQAESVHQEADDYYDEVTADNRNVIVYETKRRVQAETAHQDANEYYDEVEVDNRGGIVYETKRRSQVASTHQDADDYYDDVELDNRNVVTYETKRKTQVAPTHQDADEYYDELEVDNRDVTYDTNNHRRTQAVSTHQDADDYYDEVEADNRNLNYDPNSKRRTQAKSTNTKASKIIDQEVSSKEPAKNNAVTKRRTQAKSTNTKASKLVDGEVKHDSIKEVSNEKRRPQAKSTHEHADTDYDAEIKNTEKSTIDGKRRQQSSAVKTSAIPTTDNNNVRTIDSIRSKPTRKHQDDNDRPMFAMKTPEYDAPTRVRMALDKAKRLNSEEAPHANVKVVDTTIKNDPNYNNITKRNNQAEPSSVNSNIELTANIPTNSVQPKQRNTDLVRLEEVNQSAQANHEIDLPAPVDVANVKKITSGKRHISRNQQTDVGLSFAVKDDATEQPEIGDVYRGWSPRITNEITAKPIHNVTVRRKKKTSDSK